MKHTEEISRLIINIITNVFIKNGLLINYRCNFKITFN